MTAFDAAKAVFLFGVPDDAPYALTLPRDVHPEGDLHGKPVIYWGNEAMLRASDIPFSDRGPHIVSKRVVDVFLGLGVPAKSFVDVDVYLRSDWLGDDGPPWRVGRAPHSRERSKFPRIRGEYFGLGYLPILDCIDWRRYSGSGLRIADPVETGVVRPLDGFPALFMMEDALGTPYWITDWARRELKRAQVVGVEYGPPARVRR